ncbi:unnamed protein product [Rotaria socialis]|uniref:GIY-YIG domain-containing protein n=1 Tax=Rotaria socialis TaxID=392032 RepID=A0A820SFR6_9BILA|nr:unnamed protein product [Rotaria socialis]CAF3467651.1 unnamed protein product [Rotaria socialis]CAF4123309.1 unnamed protein product [Rotaria socialis]CAF4455515.1 unnamed protein product [Rotaria socialis]
MAYQLNDKKMRPCESVIPSLSKSDCCVRYSILPCYPIRDNVKEELLLLANVPCYHLSRQDMKQRGTYGYHQPTMTRPINDHERRLFFLSRLWNISVEILEFNFTRLKTFANRLAIDRMQRFSTSWYQEYLHDDEYSIALEFYLQIDKDLFYMKTCSYRGAQSIHDNLHKSIFCSNEPQARYGIIPCHQRSCYLCYPSYRTHQPIVPFEIHQQHIFINGYRSILNCPATCTTKNIIYVLTCPCNKVDYIGETSLSLADRLTYHQAHGNRIIQEFLLGKQNTSRIRNQIKSAETLVKNGMKLYQHSAHCPLALQWFLDENPEYWPFVPKKLSEAEEQEEEKEIVYSTRDTQQFTYANDVPTSPNHYHFSLEQKLEIEQFFHEKKYLKSPNLRLDLYRANIIAVLPNNASDTLRRLIEALFITHTETKLNTIGHLDRLVSSKEINTTSFVEYDIWCEDLIRPKF